jgi:L,D-peptidoglycan transpeptidase YkuD (ErfK/YbiS/YcfS/YnhG family)
MQKEQVKSPINAQDFAHAWFSGPSGETALARRAVGRGKGDGSLHQQNNYNIIQQYRVKLAHSPYSHNASIPVSSINLALGYFCRLAQTGFKPLPA